MTILSIGDLSRATGTKVETIRYYEQIGLLPASHRTEGNQRRYGRAEQRRLTFIRHARELGFSLEAIRELAALNSHPEQPCHKADRIAASHLQDVRHKIARLRSLEQELSRMVEQCSGHKVCDCRVLEVLADHELCLYADHQDAALDL